MPTKEKLYNELCVLQQKIKNEQHTLTGRTPYVCSNEALLMMATLCPKKLSDLEAIPGLGKVFVENYGEEFLEVISKYDDSSGKAIAMTQTAADILKELEKKLVNINKSNRLLYMPKLSNRYAFDLINSSISNPLKIIFGKSNSTRICDMDRVSNERYEAEKSNFKKIVQLLREVNKDLRDKGQNDLYIGYPFVIGRLAGENFNVRAPLVLFPVTAERNATDICLKLDDSRDVLYNNTLLLAHFKFNKISKPLPSDTVEDLSEATFIDSIISFYQENDLKIKVEEKKLCEFTEYKASEFPEYKSGELYLEPCIVLGKYPIRSNSIQKDFDEIIERNEITPLLNHLLLTSDDVDYYSDSYSGEEEIKTNDRPLEISEYDLTYINSLNSSQENVVSTIKTLDSLVVQGPPGTGKSQTIASLIADFVSRNKTVLMVSEKKTALDVVYSRLGSLSKYALLIDDVGNKDLFYQQLSKMIAQGHFSDQTEVAVDGLSSEIDTLVSRLEVIAKKLYEADDFGIEPYKLFLECKNIKLSDSEEDTKFGKIREYLQPAVRSLKYDVLKKTHNLFRNEFLLSNLERYFQITSSYPWIHNVKPEMTSYTIDTFIKRLKALKESVNIWNNKNFIVKLFSKKQLTADIKAIQQEFFSLESDELRQLLLNNTQTVIEGAENYMFYQQVRPLYDRLSEDERAYFKTLIAIKPFCNDSFIQANNDLLTQMLNEQIEHFKAQNFELFLNIDNFDGIVGSLSKAIASKQKITRQKLEAMLSNEIYKLTVSKHHNEIMRVIESKRKWSVNKFIKKFHFELLNNIKIWLLTPEVVSEILPLETGLFDLVVFDEASQMFVEKGIPSILRAKKVIIAGDDKQLRPSNIGSGRIEQNTEDLSEDDEISPALEEESLLDLARFKYQDVMLNFHYRSRYEELIAFSNYAFYKGRLYVSPNAEKPEKPPIEVHKMENAMWVNRSNMVEAKYIVELLKKFFTERTANETIGIITFNSNQRDLIDDLIDEECAKDPEFNVAIKTELNRKQDGEDIGLFVKNIENVQGDERDVIIFSICYAKNEDGRLVTSFGWLDQKGGENRLNVAISRAKKKIHIVASLNPSEIKVENAKNEGRGILKKYLEYAFAVSNNDSEAAKQILHSFGDESNPEQNLSFDSEFEMQVYDALTEKGYQVDTQVGIGGYSIDLAIKRDGKYILGIECDGRLYHSSKSARERDYHRQKYLESRGWRIHRIWSTNWWNNPKQEIAKICTLADSL